MNKLNTLSVVLTNSITSSQEFQNLTTLLKDALQAILVISSVIAPFALGYCFLRKMNADEQDQKMWRDRIKLIIICFIALLFITGGINLLESYLKVQR